MPLLRPLLTLALAAALWPAGAAHADYLWLQRDAAGALELRAGLLHKPLSALPQLRDAKARADGKAVDMQPQADHVGLGTPAGGDLRFTATRIADEGVLVYEQARFGRSETRAQNDLELVPTTPEGDRYQLLFKGRAVAASQLVVETAEGWRRVLKPAADGSFGFTPWIPGLYVLEVSARLNNGSVTLDGKTYTDVRHTATLSFEVQR